MDRINNGPYRLLKKGPTTMNWTMFTTENIKKKTMI